MNIEHRYIHIYRYIICPAKADIFRTPTKKKDILFDIHRSIRYKYPVSWILCNKRWIFYHHIFHSQRKHSRLTNWTNTLYIIGICSNSSRVKKIEEHLGVHRKSDRICYMWNWPWTAYSYSQRQRWYVYYTTNSNMEIIIIHLLNNHFDNM